MADPEMERRRFVTRHDVEDAAAAGRSLVLSGRDTLTDEAAQRAQDLGVAIERNAATPGRSRSATPVAAPAPPSAPDSAPAEASAEQVRRAVRAAVVAELGHEPDGLDAAIDRVLGRPR